MMIQQSERSKYRVVLYEIHSYRETIKHQRLSFKTFTSVIFPKQKNINSRLIGSCLRQHRKRHANIRHNDNRYHFPKSCYTGNNMIDDNTPNVQYLHERRMVSPSPQAGAAISRTPHVHGKIPVSLILPRFSPRRCERAVGISMKHLSSYRVNWVLLLLLLCLFRGGIWKPYRVWIGGRTDGRTKHNNGYCTVLSVVMVFLVFVQ